MDVQFVQISAFLVLARVSALDVLKDTLLLKVKLKDYASNVPPPALLV
jgi:hypothetical protein